MDRFIDYIIIVTTILVIPCIFIGLWFPALRDKNSKWYWNSARLILLTGYIWSVTLRMGTFDGAWGQFDIYQRERRFFWHLFEMALAKHPDFQAAVASMSTVTVHQDVTNYINSIFPKYTIVGMELVCFGGVLLLSSWVLMLFYQKWKHQTWMAVVLLVAGLAFFGGGSYSLAFGKQAETRLESMFYQQKYALEQMKDIIPVMSNDVIIPMVREHAEYKAFGDEASYRLIEKLENKVQNNQD